MNRDVKEPTDRDDLSKTSKSSSRQLTSTKQRFKIKKKSRKGLHRLMPIKTIGREDAYNVAFNSNLKAVKKAVNL